MLGLILKGCILLTKLNKKLAAKRRDFSNKFKPPDRSPQVVCFLPSGSSDNHTGWGRVYALLVVKRILYFFILR